jgi:hypothetical protein
MACRFTNWIDTLLINKTRQSINKSIHRIPKEKRFVSSEPFLFCIKFGYIDFTNAGLHEGRKNDFGQGAGLHEHRKDNFGQGAGLHLHRNKSLGQDAALHLAPNWRI